MLQKIKKGISQAKNSIIEEVTSVKDSTLRGGSKLINSWLDILPILEECGFEITCFAMGYSISPTLEVELKGRVDQFPDEKIKAIMELHPKNGLIKTVFQAIKTTLHIYKKSDSTPQNDLIVSLRVRISPEVKVFVGTPTIQ